MLVVHLGGALQQTAMEVEDVAGIGFAARRPPKQQRNLAVGPGVLGEVVVDDQGLLALLHELLSNGAARVGRQVLEGGGLRRVGRHHHRVLHGAVLLQSADHLGHLGSLLANGHVDAEEVLPLLVDDGVHSDGCLAGGAVPQNQLPLATPDGDHGVDGLDARLHGRVDGLAHGDVRGNDLDGAGLVAGDAALAVQGPAKGVDNAAQKAVSNGCLDDAPGRLDLVAFADGVVLAKDHDTNTVRFQVQGDAKDAGGKLHQLVDPAAGEPVNPGDAVPNLHHGPHVHHGHSSVEALELLLDD